MFMLGGGSIYRLLNKDIKELNVVILSLFCVVFLFCVGFISYRISFSYALFSDSVVGNSIIEISPNLNLDKSGVNEPVIAEGMIPVYYDSNDDVWRKADQSNISEKYKWYDYDNKMWANSVTVSGDNRSKYLSASVGTEISMDDILTMQVWIPRYKYKVWNYNSDGSKTSSPQKIEIVFENGTNSTGDIVCSDSISGTDGKASETCKLKESNSTCTDSICNNKMYTHPAFTFGEEEISGFWIGKFELASLDSCTAGEGSSLGSGCNLKTIRPIVKPDVSSFRGAQLATYEYVLMNMNGNDNIYGLGTSSDTHMIKNIEWGAVSYLSYSKYGTCTNGSCIEVGINNNSNYITGCGAKASSSESSTCNRYNTSTGMFASTTGNIYGVYDMSGAGYEYAMGNSVYSDGKTMVTGYSTASNSGYSGYIYNNGSYKTYTGSYGDYNLGDKYIDWYSFSASNTTLIRSKLGDGVKEVFVSDKVGWYDDYCTIVRSNNPWVVRGSANSSGSSAGLFSSGGIGGSTLTTLSSRLVIIS